MESRPVRGSADAHILFSCRKFYVGGGSNADDFYTLASARQAYRNHLKVVTSRKNTINGKVRGDSPVTYSLWSSVEVVLQEAHFGEVALALFRDTSLA